jgi:hypothetical protein
MNEDADAVAWSRAYFTVMLLSLVLIPASTLVACFTLRFTTFHLAERLHARTSDVASFLDALNPWGIGGIGAGALMAIIALFPRREKPGTVWLAGTLLITCSLLMLFAAYVSVIPFMAITMGPG